METTDVDDFLRTDGVSMPMGVSGLAGKSTSETGVLLREGTDISRDTKSGNVLVATLVKESKGDDLRALVTSFVYDVEYSSDHRRIVGGRHIKDQFLINSLFGPGPRGRFSF